MMSERNRIAPLRDVIIVPQKPKDSIPRKSKKKPPIKAPITPIAISPTTPSPCPIIKRLANHPTMRPINKNDRILI
jgi:hypothetical protein